MVRRSLSGPAILPRFVHAQPRSNTNRLNFPSPGIRTYSEPSRNKPVYHLAKRMASTTSTSNSGSSHQSKTIVICCDGTWQNSNYGWKKDGFFGLGPGHAVVPTNVTHISRALAAEDKVGNPQIVYYQAGVGTGWSVIEQLWGGSTGEGLGENIREAYAFLVNNYQDGDRIVLIGFSRGAFTARSIGGLIGDFGLLDKRYNGMQYFYNFFVRCLNPRRCDQVLS
jgi:uncharacterized protein (DUF2235 family)